MPDVSQAPVPLNSRDTAPRPQAKSVRWWFSRLVAVGIFFGAGVLLIFLLGLAQRFGWIERGGGTPLATTGADAQEIYTCSMHPQIRQLGPGRCPICGMALVPATSAGTDLDKFAVTIQPAQRRLAHITTAKVSQHPVESTIETIGAIQIDESRQSTIAAYIDGRVERLFADYTGVEVEEGDHLAVVYSPQLFSAQVEYIEAKRTLDKSSSAALASVREAQTKLVANSRQKLVELGVTEEQLAELESSETPKSRLTIYSPIGGTVIEKLAEEGKYISAGEPIYRIANLSTVWLMLELYPEDASRIQFGQVVKAELTSLPGEALIGRVAFVDPTVNNKNRTVGVRVEFKNDQRRLRPGDYAQATIEIPIGSLGKVYDESLAGKWISPMHPQIIRDEPGDCPICGMKLVPTSRYGYSDQPVEQPVSVVVPRSALLMAGKHSVVYVETKPGRFELRNVILGPILKDEAIILAGLSPGEEVAISGNFLIDSQMQLAGKPSLIDPTRFESGNSDGSSNAPLQFDSIDVVRVKGQAGENLERLYQSYFEIQKSLTEGKQPAETAVGRLSQLSDTLINDGGLKQDLHGYLNQIRLNSVHLHHLSVADARKKFRLISQAVITLSTEVRGENAQNPFYQFFCPMVDQGKGDWLQADDQIRNPYMEQAMLGCGELIRSIPPNPPDKTIKQTPEQTDTDKKTPTEGDK